MAIIYNWIIESLDVIPQEGTLVNVVSVVHWRQRYRSSRRKDLHGRGV
jgi:hypothetical protein